jgi:hypothetical protein
MDDRAQRQAPPQDAPWTPKQAGPFEGPRVPDITRPETRKLVEKMKQVEKNSSKKYRQRTGQ